MDDVADAVGLNKATVYHYYASKSLILFDICKSAADFTVGALHDDPSASAREMIYHFTRRLLVGIASDIERGAVYFQEAPYITEWFTEEQVAYIRKAESNTSATSSTAASPAGSSTSATPTCWRSATSA
jgi:AcrR family transcriptional regulator